MKKIFPLFFIILILSCRSSEKNDLEELEWLVGKWEGQLEDNRVFEQWEKSGDELTGNAFLIFGSDTISTETLKIEKRENEIYYVATPSEQAKTDFKLISITNNEAIFENPEHDFPKRIIYRKIAGDSLYARIEGDNKFMEFYWRAVK